MQSTENSFTIKKMSVKLSCHFFIGDDKFSCRSLCKQIFILLPAAPYRTIKAVMCIARIFTRDRTAKRDRG